MTLAAAFTVAQATAQERKCHLSPRGTASSSSSSSWEARSNCQPALVLRERPRSLSRCRWVPPAGRRIGAEVASPRLWILGVSPSLSLALLRTARLCFFLFPYIKRCDLTRRTGFYRFSMPPYLQYLSLSLFSPTLSPTPATTTLLTSSSCHVISLLGLKIDPIETNGGRQTDRQGNRQTRFSFCHTYFPLFPSLIGPLFTLQSET